MKKVLLMAAVALVLGATACAPKEDASSSTAPASTNATTTTNK